jgi:hypothetical protein
MASRVGYRKLTSYHSWTSSVRNPALLIPVVFLIAADAASWTIGSEENGIAHVLVA